MSTTSRIPTKTKHKCGPRVKTGCQTCRLRRVKCDESRPACRRCTTTGRSCDGYPNFASSNNSSVDSDEDSSSDLRDLLQPKSYAIPFQIPGSQRDRQLLHFYCVSAAFDLAGYETPDFWHETVLKHCEHTPVLRQSVIAYSAARILSRTITGKRPGSPVRSRGASNGDSESLLQYDKALRWLRKYIATSPNRCDDMVSTCTTLLFAACMCRCEVQEALIYVRMGARLLETKDLAAAGSTPCGEGSIPRQQTTAFSADQEINVTSVSLTMPQTRQTLQHCITELRAIIQQQLDARTSESSSDLASTEQDEEHLEVGHDREGSERSAPPTPGLTQLGTADGAIQLAESYIPIKLWLEIVRESFPNEPATWLMCPNPSLGPFLAICRTLQILDSPTKHPSYQTDYFTSNGESVRVEKIMSQALSMISVAMPWPSLRFHVMSVVNRLSDHEFR